MVDESAVVAQLRAAGCVFAEDEAALLIAEAPNEEALRDMVNRRVAGLPLEHILRWVEFCGARYVVEPGVFVPRQRTELMVREAVAALRGERSDAWAGWAVGAEQRAVVVDMCCGSGAVGCAVARAAARDVELFAADVDPAAVACAVRNVGEGKVFLGDLFEALPGSLRGRIDVVVANTPYVPTDAIASMPPEAREYEPNVALDGGSDGLDVQRRLLEQAVDWLAPGGHVLVETSQDQAAVSAELFRRAGLWGRIVHDDELYATVVVGVKPTDRRQ